MKLLSKQITCLLLAAFVIGGTTCKNEITGDKKIGDSLEPIEEVTPVAGAENVTLIVETNPKNQAYFDLAFNNIQPNAIISDGNFDGWCIDAFKSINSNGGTYDNLQLFSTDRVEKWMPINYLLNIREDLIAKDQELTWLEIQLAVWSLRTYPNFRLDDIVIADLPGQFHKDGEPLFNHQKVSDILELVNNEYEQFDYTKKGTKYAIVAKLPVDVQTVFAVVEKN